MKFLTILLLEMVLVTTKSVLNYKLASNETNCPILLPLQNNTQIILINYDRGSPRVYNLHLQNCILKNKLSEVSFMLLDMNDTNTIRLFNSTTRHIMKDKANIIIFTKSFNTTMIISPLFKLFLDVFVFTHLCVLNIVITSRRKYKCEDGTMSQKDFIHLDNTMNELWHRYKIMYVGVLFPYTCKQKIVIYNGKRPSNRSIYDRPIQLRSFTNTKFAINTIIGTGRHLAEQFPLRASIFERNPTSTTDCKNLHYYHKHFNLNLTGGFCGLDAMVMHDILTYFKFNISLTEDENCKSYGYMGPPNVSYSLGCIARQEIDISFNSRFITLYSDDLSSISYLHYVTSDELCALIKISDVIPVWHGVFNVYKLELWLLIISVIVLLGVLMWSMAMFSKSVTDEKTMSPLFFIHVAVMTTIFGYTVQKTRRFRTLRGACLLSSIIFGAIYQSHTNHVYTTLQRFERIQTLTQLYKSGATLYVSPSIKELVKQLHNPEDKLQADFFCRLHSMPTSNIGIVLEHPKATTIDRKTDVKKQLLKTHLDKMGRPLVDVVDESFNFFYLSYITRQGFPFFEQLQVFMARLTEAGLPTAYYRWTQRMLGLPDSLAPHRDETRPLSKITIGDVRIGFAILALGQILSTIVFVIEIWRGRGH